MAVPLSLGEMSSSFNKMLLVVLVLAALLIACAIAYVRSRWSRWFRDLCKRAFDDVDIDHSKSIDNTEMYAAVLLMYVKINQYTTVRAPPRDMVMQVIENIDVDQSGGLNFEEFTMVMKVFSEQLLGRTITQTAFTISCPLVAGYVVGIIRRVAESSFENPWSQVLPEVVTENVPVSLPATVLASVMMVGMVSALQAIDDYSVRASKHRAEKLSKRA